MGAKIMSTSEWIVMGMGAIFTIIGYLLAQKDSRQSEQIKDLYDKCAANAKNSQNLELQLARDHYPKAEVQALLENFKNYLNERFDRIEQAVGFERRNTK